MGFAKLLTLDRVAKVNKLDKLNIKHNINTQHKLAIAAIVARTKAPRGGESAMSEFLNVRETARQLGVHENTVRNLEKRGLLQAARLPGSGFRRFRKDDVDRMRDEMWSDFAPDTSLSKDRRKPTKRHTLTEDDYGA